MSAAREHPGGEVAELARIGRLIRAQGWDRKRTGRILGELVVHVIMAVGGLVLFLAAESWWIRALAVIVGTVGQLGVGLNSHSATHHAASDRPWVNDALLYFGYAVMIGLSATYWRHSHVRVHHRHPVVIGLDDDFDLMPWFAVSDVDVERASGWKRAYYARWQWLVLPFGLALNGLNMMRAGLVHLFGALRRRRRRRGAHWIDLGALVAHWGLSVALPLVWWPAADVAAFYALRVALIGFVMFAVFAPGHYPAEVAGRLATAARPGFAQLQTGHTLDFRAGWLGRLYVAGLDHQIEHHLFPGLSHVNYPKLAPVVREFCERHGFPYRSLSWGEALWKSVAVFRTPKRVVRDPATARRP